MSIPLCIALYFVIWWMTLFAVLPFRIRSQYEAGDVVPGSEGAAPLRPMMLWRVMVTTLVASVVFAAVYAIVVWHLVPASLFDFTPKW